jgi:non-heme chloroperoxidase
VPLTYDQFHYGFANAVGEEEAKQLYETYAVPTPGKPLFQAAANLKPWTEDKVDTKNPDRGPLLLISASGPTPSRGRSSTPPSSSSRATRA